MPSPEELESLRRHHNATIGLFVAFWICVVAAIAVIELVGVSARTEDALIGTLFGGAVVLVLLQLARRCPVCRANLGFQARLGIPRTCTKCGTTLRGTSGDRRGGEA